MTLLGIVDVYSKNSNMINAMWLCVRSAMVS